MAMARGEKRKDNAKSGKSTKVPKKKKIQRESFVFLDGAPIAIIKVQDITSVFKSYNGPSSIILFSAVKFEF